MAMRGIRGATTVTTNTNDAMRQATQELLLALRTANDFDLEEVASIFFTTTPDLTAEAPARAARELGWHEVAMLCLAEMSVTGGLERCIRVLIHWNTDKCSADIRHIYLREAAQLRPDRALLTPLHPVAWCATPPPTEAREP